MANKDDHKMRCSFCGKPQDMVYKLITGPGVCICDECVELCNSILYDEEDLDAATTVKRLNLDNAVLNNMRREAIAPYASVTHSPEEWKNIASAIMELDENMCFNPFCFAIFSYITHFKVTSTISDTKLLGIL